MRRGLTRWKRCDTSDETIRGKAKAPSRVATGEALFIDRMSRADETLTGQPRFGVTLARDPSGCREARWDSDPASSTPVSVGPSVLDSSGLVYCWCSYVEHSFLSLDTTPPDQVIGSRTAHLVSPRGKTGLGIEPSSAPNRGAQRVCGPREAQPLLPALARSATGGLTAPARTEPRTCRDAGDDRYPGLDRKRCEPGFSATPSRNCPVAFSGGSRLNTAPLAPEMSSTFPVYSRP